MTMALFPRLVAVAALFATVAASEIKINEWFALPDLVYDSNFEATNEPGRAAVGKAVPSQATSLTFRLALHSPSRGRTLPGVCVTVCSTHVDWPVRDGKVVYIEEKDTKGSLPELTSERAAALGMTEDAILGLLDESYDYATLVGKYDLMFGTATCPSAGHTQWHGCASEESAALGSKVPVGEWVHLPNMLFDSDMSPTNEPERAIIGKAVPSEVTSIKYRLALHAPSRGRTLPGICVTICSTHSDWPVKDGKTVYIEEKDQRGSTPELTVERMRALGWTEDAMASLLGEARDFSIVHGKYDLKFGTETCPSVGHTQWYSCGSEGDDSTSTNSDSSDDDKMLLYVIIAAVGAVVLIAIVVVVAVCCVCKKAKVSPTPSDTAVATPGRQRPEGVTEQKAAEEV